jgi:hypothetical protein
MCQIVNSFNRSRLTVRHSWVKSREMTSYPSTQRSTIFQHVGVLIYVFGGQRARRGQGRRILPQLPRRAAEVFALARRVSLRPQAGSRRGRRWGTAARAPRARAAGGVEPCPSRYSVRASTTRRCTTYAIRRRFVSRAFFAFSFSLPLSHLLLRVSGLTGAGMV